MTNCYLRASWTVSRRVQWFFYYHARGTAGAKGDWDSGLLPSGGTTQTQVRPAYDVLRDRPLGDAPYHGGCMEWEPRR